MSLSHKKAREYLQLAADGLLGSDQLTDLQHHLSTCAECRGYANTLDQLERRLTRSLRTRWRGSESSHAQLGRTIAQVRKHAGRRQWFRRIYGGFQAVAWTGLAVALVVVVGWMFNTVTPERATAPPKLPSPTPLPPLTATPEVVVEAPTATPEVVVEAPTATPEAEPEPARELVICMGAEPESLYLYGSNMLAQKSVLEAVYDGPIDDRNFGHQPIILEKLPSLSDGDAAIEKVIVGSGEWVLGDDGEPVELKEGVLVRPSACYSSDCALPFDGASIEMEQMVVTFKLKSGIRWSDGEPLTAYDSVYAFELDRDPDTPTDKTIVNRTARYEALYDYTVVWAGLPGLRDPEYAIRFWSPLPEHAWGEMTALELLEAQESVRYPLGWGPYVIQQWVPGQHIELVKNKNYWRAGEGLPKFDTVIYRFVAQNSSANIAALLAGECDILDLNAHLDDKAEVLLELQSVGVVNASFATGIVWEHADFGIDPVEGYDRPDFFEDVRVRRAIAYCMDRQAMVDAVLHGQSTVPHTYLPPEHPLYNPDVRQYRYEPETGSALLERAGWMDHDDDPETPRVAQGVEGVVDSTLLSFNFATTDADQRKAATKILADSLAQCGIQIDLDYWSPGEFFADGPSGPLFGRRFDMSQFAWLTGTPPPCDLYLSSRIPGEENGWVGENNSGFNNPEYDAACSAALQALPGTSEYEQLHKEAQRIFAEQLPVIPLYLRLKLAVTRPDLQGFEMDPTAESEFWNIEAFQVLDP